MGLQKSANNRLEGSRREAASMRISGFIGLFLLSSVAMASAKGLEAAGRQAGVASTGNKVELRLASTNKWITCQVGDLLAPGDTIKTGPKSTAALLLSDQTMMRLGENTEITLVSMAENSGSLTEKFMLGVGRAWANVTPGNHLQIEGPNAVAAVKGTVLEMDCPGRGLTKVRVWEGVVECQSHKKKFSLEAGHGLAADAKGARPELCALDPKDQFQNWNVAFDKQLEVAFVDPPMVVRGDPSFPAPRPTRPIMKGQTPAESGGGGEAKPEPAPRTKRKRIIITPEMLKDFASKNAVKP